MDQKSIFCDLFVHLEVWGQSRVDLETFLTFLTNPLAFLGLGTPIFLRGHIWLPYSQNRPFLTQNRRFLGVFRLFFVIFGHFWPFLAEFGCYMTQYDKF